VTILWFRDLTHEAILYFEMAPASFAPAMSFDSYASIEASPRPVNQTAQIREDAYCLTCGWPVIFVYCNDGMARIAPYSEWNAWTYCTNKTCKHHDGEGVLHNMPGWIRSAASNQPLAAPAHQRTGAAKSGGKPSRQRRG
jgi:hypothetical protein